MRGREEGPPDKVLGALGGGGDLVHVQIGGVGGQHAARFADRVELAEDLLFDVHVLEDRFDDQIDIFEAVVFGGDGERFAGQVIELRLIDLATFQRALEVARDAVMRGLGGLVLHLDQHDREARQERRRGDPCPHGATADHADGFQLPRPDAFQLGQVADLSPIHL